MFRLPFSNRRVPLTGAPAIRRIKAYSAMSGFVYQYFYEGYRPFRSGRESGLEFVYTVSSDRKEWLSVAVFVSDAALNDWQLSHERQLLPNERRAIAKMALLQAFDERPTPAEMTGEVHVQPRDVETIIDTLGL